MAFGPKVPIGKAREDDRHSDDAEVSGHGLLLDTGEPAAHVPTDVGRPADDYEVEVGGHLNQRGKA